MDEFSSVQPMADKSIKSIGNLWGLTDVPCLGLIWKNDIDSRDCEVNCNMKTGVESDHDEELTRKNIDDDLHTESSTDVETRLIRMQELRIATSNKLINLESDILSTQQHTLILSNLDIDSEPLPTVSELVTEVLPSSEYQHLLSLSASPKFNKNRILAGMKVLRDLTPSVHELNTLYLSLSEGTALADGLCIDSQQEILNISSDITKLLSDVLELPTTVEALNKSSSSFTECDQSDKTQVTIAQMKISQQVICARIEAISVNDLLLEETLGRIRTWDVNPCSSLLSHQQELLEKTTTAISKLSENTTTFKKSFGKKCCQKEREIESSERKRSKALKEIEEHRLQIEDKFKIVLGCTNNIKHLETELSKQKQIVTDVESQLSELSHKLDNRKRECQASVKLCHSLTQASKQICSIGSDIISQGKDSMNELLNSTHSVLYSEIAKHWDMIIVDRKRASEELRTTKQLLEQETSSVRIQRAMGTSTSILQLQEQLLTQREELIKQRKQETLDHDKELNHMSEILNRFKTFEVLSTPVRQSGKGNGTKTLLKDFRLPYYEVLKNAEARDQLENIQDSLCLVCDLKGGVSGISFNRDPLDHLLEQLVSLDYRGSLPAVKEVLNSEPDTKKSIQLLHSIIAETLKAIPNEESSSGRSTANLLMAVKTKVGILLDSESKC